MTSLRTEWLFLAFGLTALGCLIHPPTASATTQAYQLDLAATAKKSGIIFAGTVESIDYAMDPAGQTALTFVHFRDVIYAKGNRKPKDLTLTLRGGKTDKDWSFVVDQPQFEVSKRYIALVHDDLGSAQNMYLPIIGLDAGFFPVVPDPVDKTPHVHDWKYRPIAAIRAHHLVVVDKQRRKGPEPVTGKNKSAEPPLEVLGSDEDPGTRIEEDAFLRAVRVLAR